MTRIYTDVFYCIDCFCIYVYKGIYIRGTLNVISAEEKIYGNINHCFI